MFASNTSFSCSYITIYGALRYRDNTPYKFIKIYILSKTSIPNKFKPNFKVLAVKSHNANREVLTGSSDFKTGQFSKNWLNFSLS